MIAVRHGSGQRSGRKRKKKVQKDFRRGKIKVSKDVDEFLKELDKNEG